MRGKNRNSIATPLKLPQFTTMNVIDGQAGLVLYSSLIFYSLTIDNILNIIVLLILAGITITMVLSNGGIIGKAKDSASIYNQKAKEENGRLADYENAILKANNGESILAQKISSDDVAFEPVDPNWKVHSVKEALDYLYENQ